MHDWKPGQNCAVNVDMGETVAHLQNTYLPIMVRPVQSRAKLMNVNNKSACSVIPALLAQGQCPDGNSQRTKQRSGNSFLPFITKPIRMSDDGVMEPDLYASLCSAQRACWVFPLGSWCLYWLTDIDCGDT